ncbi:MAG: phosphoribosylformimino-5-aminoimidazole carboxamide ribotide isomerase [Lachnospiraceae bacterium]|nr:phosphoribosylformimino-5-aminoimidazole carboxamide ribotide isomerase [Lachnospiraceae bacterium]
MKFRPCIDIHDGKVKQIIGSSLREGKSVKENFVSEKDAAYFAELYKEHGLTGGHIIILNKRGTDEYSASREQALGALAAFPGGMQIGGGITDENAAEFLDGGASHVIVTSYVFKDGKINYRNLDRLVRAVGKEKLVLDLSCMKLEGRYVIVTDRWQNFTDVEVNGATLDALSKYCDEFLVHATHVEGKKAGIDEELANLLGNWDGIPVTYAGGIHSPEDIEQLRRAGGGRLDYTVGSALNLFGGTLDFNRLINA